MIALGSTSYPFLAIAQHQNVEYQDVLDYADYARFTITGHAENTRVCHAGFWSEMPTPVLTEIYHAVLFQERVRRGEVSI